MWRMGVWREAGREMTGSGSRGAVWRFYRDSEEEEVPSRAVAVITWMKVSA